MSQRKILVAKRHDQRSFNRGSNPPPSIPRTNQAQKRGHEAEETEPPNKRRNNSVSRNERSSFSSPPSKQTKNLAAKRLQNLRSSLESQRRLSESGQSAMAVNTSPPLSPTSPKLNSSNTNTSSSTPVNDRLKRKSNHLLPTPSNPSLVSPSSSNRDNRVSNVSSTPSNRSLASPVVSTRETNRVSNILCTPSNRSLISPNVSTHGTSLGSSILRTPSNRSLISQNVSTRETNRISILNSSPFTQNISTTRFSSVINSSNYTNSPICNVSSVRNVANVSVPEQVEDEGMDWTDIDDKTVVNDVIDLRKDFNYSKNLPLAKDLDNPMCFISDGVFVVVDTNIFLSQLMLLSELKGKHIAGLGAVTVVVPWMVLQELDYMKDTHCSRKISKAARKAVSYINSLLQAKDPHFTGQTVMDAAKSEMSSANPDDGIVFSCLQLIQKGKHTVLLSNDTNLRNKALIHSIRSYSHSDIASLASPTPSTPVHSVAKLKLLLSNLLTQIISSELQEAYGELWSRMGGPQPPFTAEEALQALAKYWVAVFGFHLQKQARAKVDEFAEFMRRHPNDSNYNTEKFNKFIELSLCLCIYLKNGYLKYRDVVTECISNIQKCAES